MKIQSLVRSFALLGSLIGSSFVIGYRGQSNALFPIIYKE
jgi:hypothetical protein